MISKLIMPEMNILLVPWKHKTQSKVTTYDSHTQCHDKR